MYVGVVRCKSRRGNPRLAQMTASFATNGRSPYAAGMDAGKRMAQESVMVVSISIVIFSLYK
jgi:hypothetical protein